jgi:hypothetical protein
VANRMSNANVYAPAGRPVFDPAPTRGDRKVYLNQAGTPLIVDHVSTSAYVATLADVGRLKILHSIGPLTARLDALGWQPGDRIDFGQGGPGQLTVTGGAGVTVVAPTGFGWSARSQYVIVAAVMMQPNVWYLHGDLVTGPGGVAPLLPVTAGLFQWYDA